MDPKIDIDNDQNDSDKEEVSLTDHNELNIEEPWWMPVEEHESH